ncbi:MAG: NAD(P)H-dependent oxidoreductase [Schleiferiaceae bacterium]|jgi:azobenzene reductase|nr:NAD(P)H-dependent oxidoreductase [Schleiferiaceae bacterium]
MKIAIISGSARKGRESLKVAKYVQHQFDAQPAVRKTVLLDVAEFNFPVMDERLGYLDTPHPRLQEFSDELMTCQALIIVTPEYNGGMAGSLKNTLDYFRKEFARLPMGAVTVSSGPFGGANALHSLWFWMLYNGGIVSPSKLWVSDVANAFNDQEEAIQERLIRNTHRFVLDMMWLAEKIDHQGPQ